MTFKKKEVKEIIETPVTVQVKETKQVEEKRDFNIIERETKRLKVIKKSEYNPDLHIAI